MMNSKSDRFDVVVVGSRVAGAPTALLLAKLGLRVLLADRARFPSDTVSSHQLQVPGVAALKRWGVLDGIRQDGVSEVRELRLTVRKTSVRGHLPVVDGVGMLLSPRRSRLDHLLRCAAVEAGAVVAEGFAVDDVDVVDGRVVGVVGRDRRRAVHRVSADLVVGADGKNSAVAKAVRAPVLRSVPQQTIAAYAYWRGKPTTQAEVHHLPGRAVAVFPTDDNLTVTFVAAPADELARVRRDPLHFVRSTLARCLGTGVAVQTDELAERVRLAPELPHRMLQAHGPGWALVGDAGMVMDPVSAQGMTNAFLSAEMLARAVAQALDVGRPIDSTLDLYQKERDEHFAGMFAFTADLARLAPSWQSAMVVRRLGRSQQAIDRLLAVFSGLEPPDTFFGVRNLARLLGPAVRRTAARDAPRT